MQHIHDTPRIGYVNCISDLSDGSHLLLLSLNAHVQARLRRCLLLRQQKWAAGQTSPATCCWASTLGLFSDLLLQVQRAQRCMQVVGIEYPLPTIRETYSCNVCDGG